MVISTSPTDEDECELGTALCDKDATCENTVGGYNCSCNQGFIGDGFECISKDSVREYIHSVDCYPVPYMIIVFNCVW